MLLLGALAHSACYQGDCTRTNPTTISHGKVCTFVVRTPHPCACMGKIRKTTARRAPHAYTRPCMCATQGTNKCSGLPLTEPGDVSEASHQTHVEASPEHWW